MLPEPELELELGLSPESQAQEQAAIIRPPRAQTSRRLEEFIVQLSSVR